MFDALSIVGLLTMMAALAGLYALGDLFSPMPIVIGVQVAAVALMAWARLTFGIRSFHASADPTAGGLVTTGPYRYIRHPIYAAGCLIGWAGVASHFSLGSLGLGALLFIGGLTRIICEERLIKEKYPQYAEYSKTTNRMIPYLF